MTTGQPSLPLFELCTNGIAMSLPSAGSRLRAPQVGLPFRIRQAEAGDRPALAGMLSRCTESTRLRRFLGPVRSFPEP